MFTTPFWHFSVKDTNIQDKHKTKLLCFFEEWSKEHPEADDKREVLTDYHSYSPNNQRPPYFSYVVDALSGPLNDFFDNLGQKLEFGDLWFQQTKNYQRHSLHNHGSHGFSVIWYLEFDPDVHYPTKFYSPFPSALNRFSIGEKEIDTKEGDLVIFPSFLLHEQRPSFSDKRRTIVSFNLKEQEKYYNLTEQI